VAVAFALLSAISYGAGDFTAGLASRRASAGIVTPVVQTFGLLTALIALSFFSGVGPRGSALAWGALGGVGSAIGTLALYQGLAVARMTVVATLSGVLTAVIPVIVGLALGNTLSVFEAAGIVIAVPAILLVSWQPGGEAVSATPGARSTASSPEWGSGSCSWPSTAPEPARERGRWCRASWSP
jgi:uncharacterized membrane protein